MKVIDTQSKLFKWAGATLKREEPRVDLPAVIVAAYDDMITQFASTGWWTYAGSLDHYKAHLNQKPDRSKTVACNDDVFRFVEYITNLRRDRRHVNELRVNYLYAIPQLFQSIGELSELTFVEDGENVWCQTSHRFNRRRGVKIDLKLEDVG